MKTPHFNCRKSMLVKMLNDSDLELSLKEVFIYVYHWCMFEILLILRIKVTKMVNNQGRKMYKDRVVFSLRKRMKDL